MLRTLHPPRWRGGGAAVGDLMFYGRGAGGDPTASAVLGDVIDAAVNKVAGIPQ